MKAVDGRRTVEIEPREVGVVTQRLQDFGLKDKRVHVRVWWSQEAQLQNPEGSSYEGMLLDCVPMGRDYYFVFQLDDGRRTMIKTAAVLLVEEMR